MDQVGISGAALSAREALRGALGRQEELLAALVRGFERTLAAHPPPGLQDAWHGRAEQFYAEAVEELRRDLGRVAEHLDAALAETRRALNSLNAVAPGG
jgi:hypothetical protein